MSKDQNINPDSNKVPEVEQELSKVATNPKQSILILVGIIAVFLYLVFNLFFTSDDDSDKPKQQPIAPPKQIVTPNKIEEERDIPSIPKLPSTPQLEEPTPPPPPAEEPTPPPPPAEEPSLPIVAGNSSISSSDTQNSSPNMPFDKVKTEDEKKRLDTKRKSSIVLLAGTPPTKSAEQIEQETDFKYRGDMNLMLGRGKIIDAVIEMAVNSDFGGEIRAIISQDVYSEWGKNILIPKGSRVFGSYAVGINESYGRIAITWNRIDLANGYTVNLMGTGIDNLGRKGTQGKVDNKFKERLSNAVLRSVVNVAVAKSLDALIPPKISSKDAANTRSTVSNARNIANAIFSQSGLTDIQKREQICASVINSIEDKTSTSALSIQAACNKLRTDTTGTPTEKLISLLAVINGISDEAIKTATTKAEETKAQKASTQAYTDIGDTIKSFVEEQEFKPTITIDQGTVIKIYVNKDYKFPKNAIRKARWMK